MPPARWVIQAALEVHCVLGPGYREMVFESALRIELEWCSHPLLAP